MLPGRRAREAGSPESRISVKANPQIRVIADPQIRGLILVACAGVFWSLQGIAIRFADAASPPQVVFWRSVAQCLAMILIISVASRGRFAHTVWQAGRLGLGGGLCAMVAGISFVFAVAHTAIANVVFIMAASPLVAGIAAWLLMREAVERRTVVAMMVALAGIGIMVSDGLQGGNVSGYLYAVSTTVGFAGIAVVARMGYDRNMMPLAMWGAVFNLVLMAVYLQGDVAVPLVALLACVVSGGLLTAGGAACFMQGARYVPAAVLAFLSLTETVLAPIWAWLAFDEVPSMLGLLGGCVVLGAIVVETALRIRRSRSGEGGDA
jgi:drug/metabolite transporter (DMT)-like permease